MIKSFYRKRLATDRFFYSEKGFSIVEALIALAIFSIGIIAVASLQLNAKLQSRNSAEITEASAIGTTQMEELIQLPYNHNWLDPAQSPHSRTFGKYEISWIVTFSDLNGDGADDSKNVEIAVSYDRLSSKERSVNMYFIKHED